MTLLKLNTDEIIDTLPHGSGIDGEWTIERHTENHIVFRNDWHCMDEYGCYDGWLPLRVELFVHKQNKFNHLVNGDKVQIIHLKGDIAFRIQFRESAKSYLYGTKDYLYDIFHDALHPIINTRYNVVSKEEVNNL